MMKRLGLIFIAALLLSLSGCVTTDYSNAEHYHYSEVDYFKQLALSKDRKTGKEIVFKWEKDIYLKIEGQPSAKDRKAIREVLKDIAPLIYPRKVSRVADQRISNVRLHFLHSSEISKMVEGEPLAETSKTLNSFYFNGDKSLKNVELFLSTNFFVDEELRQGSIRWLLAGGLGLVERPRYRREGFFSDLSQDRFSEIDKTMIKMLYHPDIKPGMTADEVDAVFAVAKRRK